MMEVHVFDSVFGLIVVLKVKVHGLTKVRFGCRFNDRRIDPIRL